VTEIDDVRQQLQTIHEQLIEAKREVSETGRAHYEALDRMGKLATQLTGRVLRLTLNLSRHSRYDFITAYVSIHPNDDFYQLRDAYINAGYNVSSFGQACSKLRQQGVPVPKGEHISAKLQAEREQDLHRFIRPAKSA
jgi:hypothetical protein